MSVDHHERIKGVIKAALKDASMGESFGFAVTPPAVWPLIDANGQPVGPGPAWFVVVTIRGAGLGEPDISNGFPVPGYLPPDDHFRQVATGLLERCRRERDETNRAAIEGATALPAGPSMSLKDRPA